MEEFEIEECPVEEVNKQSDQNPENSGSPENLEKERN